MENNVSRRTALSLLLGAASVPALGTAHVSAAVGLRHVFVFLDDLPAGLTVRQVRALLAPFVQRNLPVSIILRAELARPGAMPPATGAFLREFLRQYAALGELVAWAPGLAGERPYFQARLATEALAAVETAMLLGQDGDGERLSPVSLATGPGPEQPSSEAIRIAGFRNLLFLADRGQEMPGCDAAGDCHERSIRLSLTAAADELSLRLAPGRRPAEALQVVLSLSGIASLDDTAIAARAGAVASVLDREVIGQRAYVGLARERMFWLEETGQRHIAVRLEPAAGVADEVARAALLTDLGRAGVTIDRGGVFPGAMGLSACDVSRAGAPSGGCAVATGEKRPAADLAKAGVALAFRPAAEARPGLQPDGMAEMREFRLTGGDNTVIGMLSEAARDVALVIAPGAWVSPVVRRGTVEHLRALVAGGATRLASPAVFAQRISADDPVADLMRETLRQPPEAARSVPLSAAERQRCLEDAAQAWRFFEAESHARTGLPPSTVFRVAGGSNTYRGLTMWDVATVVQAHLAAAELGLADGAGLAARIERILAAIPKATIAGLALPPAEIASDRRRILSRDYNATDTGRLLIALRALEEHPATRGIGAAQVRGWDLAATLEAGRIRAVERRQMVPADRSNYAHYIARGYAFWGMPALSPFADVAEASDADRHMRWLYRVAGFGALGAEPLLLEAVEMPASAEAVYLGDVLQAAQERYWRETGQMVCASEGSLDRSPWFSYQGLSVGERAAPWVILAGSGRRGETRALGPEARLISTKAAYLWAAVRPGPHSDRMLAFVRSKAALAGGGFASGIYSTDGRPTEGYSDVNTNGVVLQALAYMLRGRKPGIAG
ncbi:MAG: DUF3131 domain-containing protein [Paracoccaceae bacterium]